MGTPTGLEFKTDDMGNVIIILTGTPYSATLGSILVPFFAPGAVPVTDTLVPF